MKENPLDRPVIAITGSAGKSTTKEMIASILRRRWNILKTFDNFNGTYYTPRHRKHFEADPSLRAAVLEYGLINPQDIAYHCSVLPPDIAVITNVGSAHIGKFGGDFKRLTAEKSAIIHGMNPNGLLFLNADDPGSKQLDTAGSTCKILTVGVNQPADYQGFDIRFARDGMTFQVKLRGKAQTFFIPILGRHQICNALLAIAVADQLGFTYRDMWLGLMKYTRPKRRLTVYPLRDNMTMIDDSYSSNPHALKAALDVLAEAAQGRKIAVLGDMLVLGDYTESGHQEVGEHLAACKSVDYLLTYGNIAHHIGSAAIANGFPAKRVFHFAEDDCDALHKQLDLLMIPGTTILLKGPNDMMMARTNSYLVEHYHQEESK